MSGTQDQDELDERNQAELDAEEAAFNEVAGGTPKESDEDPEDPPAGRGKPPEAENEDPPNPGQGKPAGEGEGGDAPVIEQPWKADLSAFREQNDKTIRNVFGKIGEVGHLIKQLQNSRPAKAALPETALSRLTADYPELAKSLKADLDEVFAGGLVFENPATPDIAEQLKSHNTETLSEVDRRVEQRLLRRDHKDWETVVSSPEFRGWVESVLPPEEAKQLEDSWDADFISEKLTAFKAWKGEKEKRKQNRTTRLEQAITPTKGAPARQVEDDSEEAAFLAGFNS